MYGPYEIQNFQLKPMGLPSPTLFDSRNSDGGSPQRRQQLSLDPLRQASPIQLSKFDDVGVKDMVPFQNNQLREQLREQRSAEFHLNRGVSGSQQFSMQVI